MSGISDKAIKTRYAVNKYRFNGGNELQNQEFSDGSGLEAYDASARMYDPQIGRFWQIDPDADYNENFSPYAFADDNPILLNDPFGADTTCPGCMQEVVVTPSNNSSGVGLADTKGGVPDVTAGPAPESATSPIESDPTEATVGFTQIGNADASSSPSSSSALVLALGTLGETGGITITGTASIPIVIGGAVIYGLGRWAWPKGPISGPTQMPSGDISIGLPHIQVPNINFAKDKDDHLRGGKQNQRDASIKRYPKEFQRWYHREYKEPGDRDATKEELEELYEEWKAERTKPENEPKEGTDSLPVPIPGPLPGSQE